MCCALDNTIGANADAAGTSSTQGEDTSMGKNTAPVSLTVCSTSDSTSMRDFGASNGRLDVVASNSDDRSWCPSTASSYIPDMWAMGDYHKFATSTVWELGPILVDACSVSAGQRVLDVAAGTGNVAIRAARTGATVVAADLTPESVAAGRRAAEAEGVDLEWIEAD